MIPAAVLNTLTKLLPTNVASSFTIVNEPFTIAAKVANVLDNTLRTLSFDKN